MENHDQILGELKEFKRITIEELSSLKKTLDSVQQFQWKQAGAYLVLSSIAGGTMGLIFAIIGANGH